MKQLIGFTVGQYIHATGTAHGKRVQANLGAKNHGVILPDAQKNATLNALVGSAFGAAGQRCMALSTVVFVGESRNWIPELIERSKKLKVSSGFDPDADLGPMISPQVWLCDKLVFQPCLHGLFSGQRTC